MISQPAVPATGNGTTNTVTNTSGVTAYVSVGDNGATMANYWVAGSSVATSAHAYLMTVPPGATCGLQYTVATPVWFWSECTPAIPSSGGSVVNNTGRDVSVVFLGNGSVSAVTINGLTTNINQAPAAYTAGIPLPAGAAIVPTYSATLTWAWLDFLAAQVLAHQDGSNYASMNSIAPSGAGGYSALSTMPYATHNGASMAGLCAAVAN